MAGAKKTKGFFLPGFNHYFRLNKIRDRYVTRFLNLDSFSSTSTQPGL